MEIIRGSLDDISRPVSSEQTGGRVSSVSLPHSDRICPTAPFSLVVLPNDAAHIQLPSSSEETADSAARGPGKDQSHTDASEEDNEHFKLQRAIEESKRLDEILSAKICKQKEIRRQRKELQAKLWQEFLQNRPEGHSESAQEALNTRLFLALEAQNETEEEDDFVPVFDTQIPEHEQNGNNQHLKPSKKRPDGLIKSFGGEYEDTGEDQFESSCSGDSKGMNKQKDFVKKNIELASGERGEVLLTQAEKRRLTELLREIDEEEGDGARGADTKETMWAVSVLTDQGYTPEPSDLEHLIDIDSKIRLLLPVEEFHSVQSSYTNVTMSQGPGSEVCWKCDGDPQPGEKVLQDIKERRGQERRLQEIQRQLELLGRSQEMTSESPELTEEQLLGLMDGCELKESWSQDLEMND